jgi:uroporphyrinogen decarboxylase
MKCGFTILNNKPLNNFCIIQITMEPRERTLAAINHRQPDRPPIYVSLTPQVAQKLCENLHLPFEEPVDAMESARISHMDLLTRMGVDIVAVAPTVPTNAPTITLPDGRIKNEWGMIFRNAGLYTEFDEYPLANASSMQDVLHYPFPDPNAPGRFDLAVTMMQDYSERYAVIGDVETMFFEMSWYLTGMEKFLMDLMTEPEYQGFLMDKIMHYIIAAGTRLIEMRVDILWCGDDFGTQSGMIMDPDTWRKLFKPRIKFMFDEFRKVRSDIKIAWHSCGSILPIIPDFIELGLDILNPIQPLAQGMDPIFLKKTYGKDLVFFGGIDVQHLLPFGTPRMISDEVKRRIEILGKDGGYIVAPAHNIQPDTPVENIMAFFEAAVNPY